MLIVAGLSLKNLKPRVWDPESPHFVPGIQAVMISYADFHAMRARRRKAMECGLHAYLGVPSTTAIYLDNGAFYFLQRDGAVPRDEYEEFVEEAKPDWYPVPQEFIPHPAMKRKQVESCYRRTMNVNRAYDYDGFVPVMHVGAMLPNYIKSVSGHEGLKRKKRFAVGGIVPNLLRAPKALSGDKVIEALRSVRHSFDGKNLHVFGLGGTATIHIAGLLGFDSLDSSGWRNRAARGIVQLPGSGDRMVADLGSWRGRKPSKDEWDVLRNCKCNACKKHGIRGLKAKGLQGFLNRASHNLWVLIREAEWVTERLKCGTYQKTYKRRLDNTVYKPLIEKLVETKFADGAG